MTYNSVKYWNERFRSGEWERKGGRSQTKDFAESQIQFYGLPPDFNGTILDFGCGLGDSMLVYAANFPNAKLMGIDFSPEAIRLCKQKYNTIADFICGDYTSVPEVDVIIASNVFEHLEDNLEIAECLKQKCKVLYIIVPYEEDLAESVEHINRYDKKSFPLTCKRTFKVFKSKGWSQYGFDLYFTTYLKNVFRPLFGRGKMKVRKQIMFIFN
jgi:cyclopropane fatty-acyl-phospholipid synthase-like methyltransferase